MNTQNTNLVNQTESAPICVLVMPAYNEQDCIEGVITRWAAEFRKIFQESFRMVVVNDGSRDQTGTILDRLAKKEPNLIVLHQPNGGHGVALLAAYEQSLLLKPEYVFHVDSDDQFLPQDFLPFWENRQKSKFILGWRTQRHDALHRLVITQILKWVLFIVFGTWIPDANIPYRLIQAQYLRALLRNIPYGIFAPNIFLSVLAAKDGQKLFSIPVTHEERKTGAVSIVRWKLIKVCFRSLKELLDFRLRLTSKVFDIRSQQTALYEEKK